MPQQNLNTTLNPHPEPAKASLRLPAVGGSLSLPAVGGSLKSLPSILLLTLTISCTPQKRLDRFLKNHPYLLTTDTLIYRDTLYTNAISFDTLWLSNKTDTIVITKEQLTTQIIRHNDSIFVFSSYTGDTLYIEKHIPYPTIKPTKDKYQKRFYLVSGSALMLLILILLNWLITRRK